MNIKDLEAFLAIAETENMQLAANLCEKSPSVMSKSLKRLEALLNTQLFDRVGKHIKLNSTGAKFQVHAAQIVAQAKQTIAQCSGLQAEFSYRVAAPSILYFRWASVVSKVLISQNSDCAIEFQTHYEQEALQQLKRGSADLAIVTTALSEQLTPDLFVAPLGSLSMQVAAGKTHPLVVKCQEQQSNSIQVSSEELLEHSFITPNTSPYCGENRGIGCDGWQNQVHPRKLNMVANDYSILGQIVKSGQALAYLPDFWVRELGLVALFVADDTYQCKEEILLVSRQSHLVELFLAT